MAVFTGHIAYVTYEHPDSGYIVAGLDQGDATQPPITIVGIMPGVAVGHWVEVSGEARVHRRHGTQIEVESYTRSFPQSADGAVRYLEHSISGVGRKTAETLVATLGSSAPDILLHEPDRVLTVLKGRRAQIVLDGVRAWAAAVGRDDADDLQALTLVRGLGLDLRTARRIAREIGGDNLMDSLRRDPYQILEVPGIGFATADTLATALGTKPDADVRLQGGLLATMKQALRRGHTLKRHDSLLRHAKRLLKTKGWAPDSGSLQEAVRALVNREALQRFGDGYQIRSVAGQEARVTAILQGRVAIRSEPLAPPSAVQAAIQSGGLSPEQGRLLTAVNQSHVTVLTGGPGTGKTTSLKALAHMMASVTGEEVTMLAPTGRAAARLHETTGIPASTIHRYLFGNEAHAEPSVIIVDEMSMVDLGLFLQLLETCERGRTRLVLVGDPCQLPSIGPGQVLRDLIDADICPVVELTSVHRQAADSGIIRVAAQILARSPLRPPAGESDRDFYMVDISRDPGIGDDGFPIDSEERGGAEADYALERLRSALRWIEQDGYDLRRDVQVLSPMRKGSLGTVRLNTLLQSWINPGDPGCVRVADGLVPRIGDRVLMSMNDYARNLTNGDQGYVVGLDAAAESVTVDFNGNVQAFSQGETLLLQMSWATTVHKAQGSEFPVVVIMYHLPCHMVMLSDRLLYTAVTRAQRLALLFTTPETTRLSRNVSVERDRRSSGLALRLREDRATPFVAQISIEPRALSDVGLARCDPCAVC